MRRRNNFTAVQSRNKCKSCAEKAVLTVLCGFITLIVFKGSGFGSNHPANDMIKSVVKANHETLMSIESESTIANAKKMEPKSTILSVGDQSKLIRKLKGGQTGVIREEIKGKKEVISEEIKKEERVISEGIKEREGVVKKFSLGPKVYDWDERRKTLGKRDAHTMTNDGEVSKSPPMLMVTGSAPFACENPSGDHFLLKSIKNKMDYATLHAGISMYYNLAHISDEMSGFWSKLPLLRELMLARPDIEWFWWVDSDVLITDMHFTLPMHHYKDYNLVVHGWEHNVYVKKSWLGLNTGSFFLRNCQWSLDLLDEWAKMGPKGSVREEAGKEVTRFLSDRPAFEADDQSALVYLLIKQREVWGNRVYMESSYCLHGYWVPIVEKFDKMMDDMLEMKKSIHNRTNDVVKPYHGCGWDSNTGETWPFVTHFVGCKPCGKDGHGSYPLASCLSHMERAYNFADNQVWQRYNLLHSSLNSSRLVRHHVT